MLGRNLGLVAASALGASAFLIPAGLAPSDDRDLAFSTFSVVNPKNQVVRVPCSACLFPYSKGEGVQEEAENPEDTWFHIQSASNDLVFNFTVSDSQSLELNGATVLNAEDVPRAPVAVYLDQVPSSASSVEIGNGEAPRAPLRVNGMAVGLSDDQQSLSGDRVMSLDVMMFKLESVGIVEAVIVELLRTIEGELLILSVERKKVGSDMPLFKPVIVNEVEEVEDQHCGAFCKIKGVIESKINDLKSFAHSKKPGKKPGCNRRPFPSGKLPSHIKPGFLHPEKQHAEEDDQPVPPFFHGGRPHHGHHRHHRHHSFFHYFVRGALAVAVPILAGVAVGMFISVASLLIGRFVSFLWTKFVRGGRNGYESISLDDEAELGEAEISDEKVVYVAETDLEAPPVYENAPAYEEAQKSEQ